jgi:hypothetical protein
LLASVLSFEKQAYIPPLGRIKQSILCGSIWHIEVFQEVLLDLSVELV